jgi:hypothetical protein
MKPVESSAVFQPKQWAEKEAGKTIENRTQPELVPNQASKSNIVRGALNENGDFRCMRNKLAQQVESLCCRFAGKNIHTGYVSTRSV